MKTKFFGVLAAGTALTAAVGSTAVAAAAPVTSVARSQVGSSSEQSGAGSAQTRTMLAVASSGCPVKARVLLKDLRKSQAYDNGIAPTKRLTDVHCYKGYATAVTHPKELDPLTVVFRYRKTKKTWKVINFGSSDVCAGVVPQKVQDHLTGC